MLVGIFFRNPNVVAVVKLANFHRFVFLVIDIVYSKNLQVACWTEVLATPFYSTVSDGYFFAVWRIAKLAESFGYVVVASGKRTLQEEMLCRLRNRNAEREIVNLSGISMEVPSMIRASMKVNDVSYSCTVQCERDKGTAFGTTLLPMGKSRLVILCEIPGGLEITSVELEMDVTAGSEQYNLNCAVK